MKIFKTASYKKIEARQSGLAEMYPGSNAENLKNDYPSYQDGDSVYVPFAVKALHLFQSSAGKMSIEQAIEQVTPPAAGQDGAARIDSLTSDLWNKYQSQGTSIDPLPSKQNPKAAPSTSPWYEPASM